MAASTRPLTLGEILDRTVQLYRRNFLLFAGISALPAAVMVLAFGAVGILLSSQLLALKPGGEQGAIMLVVILIVGSLIGLPILLLAFSLALGASNFAVQHALQEEKTTIRASYTYAFQHIWRHLGILFMQALLAWVVPYLVFLAVAFVGGIVAALLAKSGGNSFQPLFVFLLIVLVVAMAVAAVLIWLRFSLAFAASTVEDKAIWPSMQRSGQLTKGTRGRIFVMFLMVGFLGYAVTFALLIPLAIVIALAMQKSLQGPTPPPAFIVLLETAYMGVAFLVRAFVMPVYTTSLQLFYYDQRIRQEGYDIEMLMAQAGWSGIVLPPPPPAAHAYPPFQSAQLQSSASVPPPAPGNTALADIPYIGLEPAQAHNDLNQPDIPQVETSPEEPSPTPDLRDEARLPTVTAEEAGA